MSSALVKQLCVIFVVLGNLACRADAGGCADWRQGPMETVEIGTSGVVYCAATWDPDDAGPLPEMLYVGGDFSEIGGVAANNIAAWDGASWRGLIHGTVNGIDSPDASVRALKVHDGSLIAAGHFTSAGNEDDVTNIARWDGHEWHPMGGGLYGGASFVNALEVHNGELFAGGNFYHTLNNGPVNLFHIARWDGANWQPVGPPGSGNPGMSNGGSAAGARVRALKVFNGELWAGGTFSSAGGVSANNIARWNGSAWLAAGAGLGAPAAQQVVAAIEVYNGSLYAAGRFNGIGDNIARWTGSAWAALGGGIDPAGTVEASALRAFGSYLYVGGDFTTAGGAPGNLIARWNGTAWSSLPSPSGPLTGAAVRGFAAYAGDLVMCGDFDAAGSTTLNNIARYNAGLFPSWEAFWHAPPVVYAMTPFGSDLIVGGDFVQSADIGQPAYNIGRWDGARLRAMPDDALFVGPRTYALKAFNQPLPSLNRELICGGQFTSAGGVSANNIARWIENDIVVLPPPAWEAMGAGFNGAVYAVERHNNTTFAGGAFTASGATAVSHIAQWNEASDTWQPVGSGLNGPVHALLSYAGALYAGGTFTNAGGVPAVYIARWTGSAWQKVGAPGPSDQLAFNGAGSGVYALTVHEGLLRIGGRFTYSNGSFTVNNLIGSNGVAWSSIGGTDGTVRALKATPLGLYAGGEFTTIGDASADRIAVWDGSGTAGWMQVQGGADGTVFALAAYHNELHAGGEFLTVRNGTITSPGWAKYHETGVPWFADHPQSIERPCGANFTPDVQVADGYSFQMQWRKDGIPLINGPTGSGSTVIGAYGNFALIDVSDADEGVYDCVVSNACGSATSNPATLTVTGSPQCLGCPADIMPPPSGDGFVDVDDLVAVILDWGTCPPQPQSCTADANASGAVDVDDLIAVILGWGACP